MYLFNGDFINRGSFGFEVILALFAYKLLYPKSFYLTRGNHEHITLAKHYGFENEVNTKYSKTMFEYFAETFETLPLANLINKKILVVHGGLSNSDITLDDIKNIYRFKSYVQANSLMEYLLWSGMNYDILINKIYLFLINSEFVIFFKIQKKNLDVILVREEELE